MSKSSSSTVRSFCGRVISSLPQFFDVDQAFFMDGEPTELGKEFDCTIRMVTNIHYHLHIPLHPANKDFTFLECLLLKEAVRAKEIETCSPFAVSVQFNLRGRKEAGKELLRSSLEVLASKDERLMENLLRNLNRVSRQSPFADVPPLDISLTTLPCYLKSVSEQEALDKPSVDSLNEIALKLIIEMGLGKLLTSPQLTSRSKSKRLPLTREDRSRISLLQDVIKPPYNIRPKIKVDFSPVRWSHIPARLFVYGPLLDLINLYREKRVIKVCLNCGKLYRPYKYQTFLREPQHYCSRPCKKTAERKRRYQRDKEGERTGHN